MMRPLSAFALPLLLAGTAHGQAVLNSAEMMGPGSMMLLEPFTTFSVIDTTIQGANVAWDFSALTTATDMSNLNVTIANPASTP